MSICRGDRVELLVQDEISAFYSFSLFDLDVDMKIRGEGIFLLILDEENPVECVEFSVQILPEKTSRHLLRRRSGKVQAEYRRSGSFPQKEYLYY